MSADEYFDIQTTHYSGMAPSVLFLFREPVRAPIVWRFRHLEHSTGLHVFTDCEGDPIAIQFRNIDIRANAQGETLPDRAVFRKRMYQFAEFMISFGQLEQGLELIKDATGDDKAGGVVQTDVPDVPESPVTDKMFDEARAALVGAD